jgi:hypothetical protein
MLTQKQEEPIPIVFFFILVGILIFLMISALIKLNEAKGKLDEFKKQSEELRKENLEKAAEYNIKMKEKYKELSTEIKETILIKAVVTAFNTVETQTDNNPCEAKFGYICGRDDVIACPRNFPAHTKAVILDKEYECMDWTNVKYNGRFDISFDKDIDKAISFGKKYLTITLYVD